MENEDFYLKISPLAFLRHQNKAYTKQIRKKNKRIKRKKNLVSQIYLNHNIFHYSSSYKRKLAQNIIWQRNYELKMAINLLKEENNSVRAKLWNIQKQNRKMDRQIQTWNLSKLFKKSNKKPYIDMATVQKVFGDQDYSIVSKKMEILEEEKICEKKQQQVKQLEKRRTQIEKFKSHLKSLVNEKKMQFGKVLGENFVDKVVRKKEQMIEELMQINHEIEFLCKNMQIKRKSKQSYDNCLQELTREYEQHKEINHQEIQKLKHETRKMREEDIGCLRQVKNQYKKSEKECLEYECFLQNEMSTYIKKKLQLKVQITKMAQKIKEKFQFSPKYISDIEPLTRQFLI